MDIGYIILISVGALVFLIITCCVGRAIYRCQKRQRRQERPKETSALVVGVTDIQPIIILDHGGHEHKDEQQQQQPQEGHLATTGLSLDDFNFELGSGCDVGCNVQ